MYVCAPDHLHVGCELSNRRSCLPARWHVRTNGRGAARICSWRWCPTLLEQVGQEFLASLLPTCSRPRAQTAPGPGRAHGSPGTARDTEHAARPRNARFVDTVDSYKIRTRRAPQSRPPSRPARPAVYGGPCQCGIFLNRSASHTAQDFELLLGRSAASRAGKF